MVLIKWFVISHFKGFDIEFGIDAIQVFVFGDEEFGVGRQVALSAIIVEWSRVAMRDGEIRILFNFYSLLPLPDEGRVYLSLLLQGEAAPETLAGFESVSVTFRWFEKSPNDIKRIFLHKISFNLPQPLL